MATVPVLGQLGGTQMQSPVNRNPAGALAGTATNTGAIPVSAGSSMGAPGVTTAAANPYAGVQAMAQTSAVPGASVDGGVSSPAAFGTANGLVGSAAPGSSTQSLNAIDPNVFSGSSGSTLAGGLNNAYGAGIGTSIADVLSTMGGSTDQAVRATISNTDLAAQQQMGNIQAQEAAGGVTPNSSTAALASSNFYNQVNSGLQSTISGMELSEENNTLSTLMSAGSAHGASPSLLSSITGGIGDVAGLAGGASSAISAVAPNASTSWLDAIAGLAG